MNKVASPFGTPHRIHPSPVKFALPVCLDRYVDDDALSSGHISLQDDLKPCGLISISPNIT